MKDLPETRVRLPLALVLLFAVVHGALFVLACDDSSTPTGSPSSPARAMASTPLIRSHTHTHTHKETNKKRRMDSIIMIIMIITYLLLSP